MLMAIDVGNTNVCVGLLQEGFPIAQYRLKTDHARTSDEYASILLSLMSMDKIDYNDLTDAIVSSVVPPVMFHLLKFIKRYLKKDPIIIGDEGVKHGIKILIDEPSELGADRIVNTVACKKKYGGSVIVVDFGTATTLDIVDKDGNYNGGAICPGATLAAETLHKAAAKLPIVEIKNPGSVIGRNTITSMQSGLYWGYVGMIEGLIYRTNQELGYEHKVLLTGGLAPIFLGSSPLFQTLESDLAMIGMYEIYRMNKKT